jgi:hypothetical protein
VFASFDDGGELRQLRHQLADVVGLACTCSRSPAQTSVNATQLDGVISSDAPWRWSLLATCSCRLIVETSVPK